jgi:membrane fusion protein, multidrug efflux system
VGLRRESDLVIASGLREGEVVVTQGQLRLAPGSRISMPGEGGGRDRSGGEGSAADGPGNGAAKESGKKKSES